jgi:hypothetical protein
MVAGHTTLSRRIRSPPAGPARHLQGDDLVARDPELATARLARKILKESDKAISQTLRISSGQVEEYNPEDHPVLCAA